MFLAQHYSYLGDTEKALALIERALEHTPTLIELYIVKGKILKVRHNQAFYKFHNDISGVCPFVNIIILFLSLTVSQTFMAFGSRLSYVGPCYMDNSQQCTK